MHPAPTGSAERPAGSAPPRRSVLLLGATYNTGNLGVGALTEGALTVLDEHDPDAEIRFLDYGRTADVVNRSLRGRARDVRLLNLRYSWKLWLTNNVLVVLLLALLARVAGGRLRQALVRSNATLREIDEASRAFALSGGDSFSDIYGAARLAYVGLPQAIVLALNKPLVLLPQTIGPFRRPVLRRIAAAAVRRAERVYVREASGLDSVASLAGTSFAKERGRYCPDLAFLMEPRRPDAAELAALGLMELGGRPRLGINVSGLLLMGGYSRDNMFGLRLDYAALVDALIEDAIGRLDADVLLVPHVYGDEPESDVSAVRKVMETWRVRGDGRVRAIERRFDQNQIKYMIGRCDAFVGARMHACIAALSQCVPAVGIAYSDKFSGVFATVGVEKLVADPRRHDAQAVLAIVRRAFQDRADWRRHLEGRIPALQRQILNEFAPARRREVSAPSSIHTSLGDQRLGP